LGIDPLIDVHAHISTSSYPDINTVLERAKSAGVEKIITCTTDPSEFLMAKELISTYPGFIYLTLGFDPAILSEDKYVEFQSILSSHLQLITGIGEVGLDHYYIRDDLQRRIQEKFFRASIRVANSTGLPLVIHSRSAGKKTLEVLHSEGAKRVLMHAFDGKASDALEASKKGFYFSIPASVVYSEQKQKMVKLLPLEAMMLETDSPVLSPIRGERNEPANIIFSAKKISEIKNIPIKKVIEVTSSNALDLFQFK